MDKHSLEIVVGATPWQSSVKINGVPVPVTRFTIVCDVATNQNTITLETNGYELAPLVLVGDITDDPAINPWRVAGEAFAETVPEFVRRDDYAQTVVRGELR